MLSGLTHETQFSFTSSNSSFIECLRKHIINILSQNCNFVLSRGKDNNDRNTISRRQELTSQSEHSFRSTDFDKCESTGSNSGGAIYCTSGSLTIEDCTFKTCKSPSGSGGAVYASGVSSFTIEKSLLTDCNATYGYGGGVLFTSESCSPLLSDTFLIACHASENADLSSQSVDDGGGASIESLMTSETLSFIFQSCRFLSCNCYDWGGGAYVYSPSALTGCKESLFSICTSREGEGLGVAVRNSNAGFFVRFCFFSSASPSSIVPDISLNRNDENFSDSSVLHSLSTKSPDISVKTMVGWKFLKHPYWLPQGSQTFIDYGRFSSQILISDKEIERHIFMKSILNSSDIFSSILISGIT